MSDPNAGLLRELAARGFESPSLTGGPQGAAPGGTVAVDALAPCAVALPSLGDVKVLVPVSLQVSLDTAGHIAALHGGEPDAQAQAGARAWLQGLVDRHALAVPGQPMPRGATHEVTTAADGSRIVRRVRVAGG